MNQKIEQLQQVITDKMLTEMIESNLSLEREYLGGSPLIHNNSHHLYAGDNQVEFMVNVNETTLESFITDYSKAFAKSEMMDFKKEIVKNHDNLQSMMSDYFKIC